MRYKAAIYQLTGHVAECPVDEMNRPRGGQGQAALRIPPDAGQVARLFAGWREELATCGSSPGGPQLGALKRQAKLTRLSRKGVRPHARSP
jgi:hypothetical protein